MIYWDIRMAEARMRERLQRLGYSHLMVYTIGCATHARDVIQRSGNPLGDPFSVASGIIDEFWNGYPATLNLDVLVPLAVQAAGLLPQDEDYDCKPGVDNLVWAVAHSTSAGRSQDSLSDNPDVVMAAVDSAYQAIFEFFHEQDHKFSREEEVRQVEMTSKVCQAEINFQIAFLSALESIPGQPPTYADILKMMK